MEKKIDVGKIHKKANLGLPKPKRFVQYTILCALDTVIRKRGIIDDTPFAG